MHDATRSGRSCLLQILFTCLTFSTFSLRGVISEVYPAMVSVFPTTEGYTSSCKDKASQKLKMDPNRNYLQLPGKTKETKKTETTRERKHNPRKGSSRRKAGMMRKQRRRTKKEKIENTNISIKNNKEEYSGSSSASCLLFSGKLWV